MKNIIAITLGVFSLNSLALDINGEAYEFTGSISSITLTDEGGVINVVGETGQYGKVWLTYNNPTYLMERHQIQGCDEVIKKISGVLSKLSEATVAK